MAPDELGRIGEVDRSEHITREYVQRGAALESRAVDIHAPRWTPTGEGDQSVPGLVAAWRPLLARGGTLIGAFAGDALVGFAIHRPDLAEATSNLAALYVSRDFRRRGVASRLLEEVVRLARAHGAARLYVSATPNGSAVGFYQRHGFEPTDDPHPAMLALEPDDIHMVRAL
jgi:GNAT superfamily N-acetyltransferase